MLAISNSTISDNTASNNGGGIVSQNQTLTLTNTTVSNNAANGGVGGGLYNYAEISTISNSTISGNSAGREGGGLYIGDDYRTTFHTIKNSTISGNTSDSDGGGIYNNDVNLTLSNTTISDNSAASYGGLRATNSATNTITNTIIANNSNGDCNINGSATATLTNSLIEGTSNCGVATLTDDPQLSALADNGGSTQTHLPASTSPVIDAGDNTSCGTGLSIDTDQRGEARSDGACDIGAVEYKVEVSSTITVNTNLDTGNIDGNCELREAIASANTDVAVDACTAGSGDDEIVFDASLSGSTITLGGTELLINTNLVIDGDIDDDGTPDITVDANKTSRVFHTTSDSTVTFEGVTISNGYVEDQYGGGIFAEATDLTINSSIITGNTADYGGGIYIPSNTLNITNSTISDNFATVNGGGLYNKTGTVTILASTLSGNSSDNYAGGIYSSGNITITNSTISGNSSEEGGGIFNDNDMTIINSTVVNNTGGGSNGGGLFTINTGSFTMLNSIVANNTGGDCYAGSPSPGATVNVTNSLIEDGGNNCGTPTLTVDPQLGDLADNGGLTQTHFPASTSPVIDAGDNTSCGTDLSIDTDQRGEARSDGACDIGAVEYKPVPTVCSLDIDGDDTVSPLGDGLLLLRYLFGFTGSTLIDSTVSEGATRSTASEITDYLDTCKTTYDIDGDDEVLPLSDGLLALRYEFGFSGTTLTDGLLGANATRTDATSIEAYFTELKAGIDAPDEIDTTAPVFTSSATASVDENQTSAITLFATDESSVTYAISGKNSDSFNVDSDTGVVSFISAPDYETKTSYLFTATATDSAGNASAQNITISINDIAEGDTTAPVFTSSATASVNENQTDAITLVATDESSVTYAVSGTDSASFSVNSSTGVVNFILAPDYEVKTSYSFTATATDSSENTSTQDVMINIANVTDDCVTPAINYPFTVVDTKQAACYHARTGSRIPCADTGQDGEHNGNLPSYTSCNTNTVVVDNVTALMWQSTTDTDGVSGLGNDDKMTQSEAVSYCSALSYGTYSDWRLPSTKELYSIYLFNGVDISGVSGASSNGVAVDTSAYQPFIANDYFDVGYGDTSAGERAIDGQYATSTLNVSQVMSGISNELSNAYFGVNFVDGHVKSYETDVTVINDANYYVRCVRGNPDYGKNDFVANNDEVTVTDNATDLMWEKGDHTSSNFADAIAVCEATTTSSWTDWRLPNIKEMQSIVDYTRSPDATNSPAIDTDYFTSSSFINEAGDTDWGAYWTSSALLNFAGEGDKGAYITFGRGMGNINEITDVHGAGAQRSDYKTVQGRDSDNVTTITADDTATFGTTAYIKGPQGDIIRVENNYVRCVRDAAVE